MMVMAMRCRSDVDGKEIGTAGLRAGVFFSSQISSGDCEDLFAPDLFIV